MPGPFDMKLRALRRDRAARRGPELFLHERAFAECLERMELVQQRIESALLIGCPDPAWPARLHAVVDRADVYDPGCLFAAAAGGEQIVEDEWRPSDCEYDLALAIGTLDTVNDLPGALQSIFLALKPGAMFLGAMSGGDTLPLLRAAMRATDAVAGAASPHIHPRIEASALALLLAQVGFVRPVIDVDRAQVSYRSFERLVFDLRKMGGTNVLTARSRRTLSRSAIDAAHKSFANAGNGERTIETFEILHFAAWAPEDATPPQHG